MNRQSAHRLVRLGVVAAMTLGVFVAGLLNRPQVAIAHEEGSNTYMVNAGAFGVANAELLAFAPSYLKVHRGDVVMFHINGFHNMHLGEQPSELVVIQEINGQPTPILNPLVAFSTLKSGDSYTGGEANYGLPIGPDYSPVFSVVIDLPVGIYNYFCDVHPGMTGIIEVVADDEVIPTPAEVDQAAAAEIASQFAPAMTAFGEVTAAAQPVAVDGVLTVALGTGGIGRVFHGLMLPYFGTIKTGEMVTWINPVDSIEGHFINSFVNTPEALQDFAPMPPAAEGQPPIIAAGPGFLGSTADGATIKAGDSFNSTFILPGQTFSLIFSEPGVYAYNCHIHPGMNGVIVVEA